MPGDLAGITRYCKQVRFGNAQLCWSSRKNSLDYIVFQFAHLNPSLALVSQPCYPRYSWIRYL